MKIHKYQKTYISRNFIFPVILILGILFPADVTKASINSFDKSLISYSKKIKERKELIELLRFINSAYYDLPLRVLRGRRIKIFLHPAHGLTRDGKSLAEKTNRISTRGLSEEYYSLKISRELYKLFKKNKNFRIITTPSLKKALIGKSQTYRHTPFRKAIALAKKHGAILLISEHLNNVNIAKRPDFIMKKGIFLSKNEKDERVLVHVKRVARGFLTLFNPNDLLGLSYNIAGITHDQSTRNKMIPDTWGGGVVGDKRFSYFNEFTSSVIFESGFLCNPKEERMLYSKKWQKKLARFHYNAIVKSFSSLTGLNLFTASKKKSKFFRQNLKRYRHKLKALKKIQVALSLLRYGRIKSSKKIVKNLLTNRYIDSKRKGYLRGIVKNLDRNDKLFVTIWSSVMKIEKLTKTKLQRLKWRLYYHATTYFRPYKYRFIRKELWKIIKNINGEIAKRYKNKKKAKPEKSGKIARAKKLNKKRYILVYYKQDDLQDALVKTFGPRTEKWHREMKRALSLVLKRPFTKGIYLIKADHKFSMPKPVKIWQTTYLVLNPKKYFSHELFNIPTSIDFDRSR